MKKAIALTLGLLSFTCAALCQVHGSHYALLGSQTKIGESYLPSFSHHRVMIKSQSPILISRSASNHSYWLKEVQTQSYNNGKLGTFYYWDQLGNLRESKIFVDIAGGNKRGLKLVFPRRWKLNRANILIWTIKSR